MSFFNEARNASRDEAQHEFKTKIDRPISNPSQATSTTADAETEAENTFAASSSIPFFRRINRALERRKADTEQKRQADIKPTFCPCIEPKSRDIFLRAFKGQKPPPVFERLTANAPYTPTRDFPSKKAVKSQYDSAANRVSQKKKDNVPHWFPNSQSTNDSYSKSVRQNNGGIASPLFSMTFSERQEYFSKRKQENLRRIQKEVSSQTPLRTARFNNPRDLLNSPPRSRGPASRHYPKPCAYTVSSPSTHSENSDEEVSKNSMNQRLLALMPGRTVRRELTAKNVRSNRRDSNDIVARSKSNASDFDPDCTFHPVISSRSLKLAQGRTFRKLLEETRQRSQKLRDLTEEDQVRRRKSGSAPELPESPADFSKVGRDVRRLYDSEAFKLKCEEKERKRNEQQKFREAQELRECSFRPQLVRKLQKAGKLHERSQSGVRMYLQRHALIRFLAVGHSRLHSCAGIELDRPATPGNGRLGLTRALTE